MQEDIDAIKYLMANIKSEKMMLVDMYKKRESKDEIYEYIRYQIREYNKYFISLKRMLQTRSKKATLSNDILSIATGISNNSRKEDFSYVEFLKESSKVNLMDLEKTQKMYKIKSKTILNLIERLKEFERKNYQMAKELEKVT